MQTTNEKGIILVKKKFITIYIDQNILSSIAKNEFTITCNLPSKFVYSPSHFKEIERTERTEKTINLYLEVLKKLSAGFVYYDNSEKYISDSDPSDLFQFYKSQRSYINLQESMNVITAYANGGNYKNDIKKIHNTIPDAFIRDTENIIPEPLAKEISHEIKTNWMKHQNIFMEDVKTFEVRKVFGNCKGNFGDLEPESAMITMYETFKSKHESTIKSNSLKIDIDSFFGFSNGIYYKEEFEPNFKEKIIICCQIFDILGFASERKNKKIENIPNILSDSEHIAYGANLNFLITKDLKLSKRAVAIYSFLKIPTTVIYVKNSEQPININLYLQENKKV